MLSHKLENSFKLQQWKSTKYFPICQNEGLKVIMIGELIPPLLKMETSCLFRSGVNRFRHQFWKFLEFCEYRKRCNLYMPTHQDRG